MKINVFFMDLKNRKETAGRRFSGSSAKLFFLKKAGAASFETTPHPFAEATGGINFRNISMVICNCQ
jgi:hypothetical protein